MLFTSQQAVVQPADASHLSHLCVFFMSNVFKKTGGNKLIGWTLLTHPLLEYNLLLLSSIFLRTVPQGLLVVREML